MPLVNSLGANLEREDLTYIYIYIYIICIHICIHKGFGSRHARLVPHRRLRQRRFSLLDQIDWYFIAEQPAPATTGAGVCE